MKQANKMWKRFGALVLAAVMVLECFNGISLVGRAAETTDYVEYSYDDITNNQLPGVVASDGTTTTLDGCAFTAKITFTDGQYLNIAGKDQWSNVFRMTYYDDYGSLDRGKSFRFWWYGPAVGDILYANSLPQEIQEVLTSGNEILLRLEFDIVDGSSTDSDVQVKIYIDNVYCNAYTFAGAASHFGTYCVTNQVTSIESVAKDYYEFTFKDAGVTDTSTNKSGEVKGLTSLDETAFRGKVTYTDRTGTTTDASPWNDKLFFGTSTSNTWDETGSLYLYYHHTQERLYINKSTYVSLSKDKIIGKTVEYYITFDIEGSITKANIYLDGTWLIEYELATSLPGVTLHAYSSVGTMSIESAVTEPTYEKTIGFSDLAGFGTEAQKISYGATKGIWTPSDTSINTLSGVAFQDYITFSEGAAQKAFLYVGNEMGDDWKGVRVYQSSGTLYVQYHGSAGLTTIVDANNNTYGLSDGKQFLIKIGIQYHYATDVVVYVWLNNTLAGKMKIDGEAQDMSTGIEAKVSENSNGYYMVCGEFSETPYEDYTRITPCDFGYPDFTFKSGKHGNTTTPHTTRALSESGTLSDLHEKYLDINLTCTGTTGSDYLIYASNGGWGGIGIRWRADVTTPVLQFWNLTNGSQDKVYGYDFSQTGIVANETFNLKLYTKINGSNITLRAIVTSETKTFEIEEMAFTNVANAGDELAVYTPNGTISVATPVSTTKEVGPYSYDLDDGNYLVIEKNATLDGEALPVGTELNQPKDYNFVIEQDGVEISKKVVLYKVGDVNLDGEAGTEADLQELETMLASVSEIDASTAAQLGADLDNDNKVGKSDLELMRAIVDGTKVLSDVKTQYHVAALTYDYLGNESNAGDEVMPIVGFYGPYKTASGNFITDEIMQLVKDSGINMVNYVQNRFGYPSYNLNVIDELRQYSKFGIGYYVSHYNWVADTTLDEQIALMADYSNYGAFIGSHLVDEPNAEELTDWYEVASYLNKYTNTNGFINLAPEDNPEVSGDYDTYWSTYIANAKPKVLSVDDYPFNDSVDEGVTNAAGYFKTLATIRAQAGNKIPFWYYVQAGGDFSDTWLETNASLQPTEAETYWNINTALAFGAKGIEWFPLVQPTAYATATDDHTEYDKNGLIGADANSVADIEEAKTDYYATAMQANKQIAAVDEVLMKASSKGIIATGGYALSQTSGLAGMITVSETSKLEGVTAKDEDYGALIGCFDYKDTEAYYVVNYSVDSPQEIVLAFDDAYHYRAVNYNDEVADKGKTCLLNIPAGEAVLVVIDEVAVTQPYVEVYPSDFGISDDTYTYTGSKIMTSGTYAPIVKGEADNTLDEKVFSASVIFSGNARINLGYDNNASYGISLMTDTRENREKHLMMRWEESGNNSSYVHFSDPISVGLSSFVGVEYNLKISMELVDCDADGKENDLKVGVWFNDKFYKDANSEDGYTYWTGKGTNFGNTLALRADTEGSYIKLGTPKLEFKDYETITTTDIGLAQAIYTPYSNNTVGRYSGDSMDGVLFSVNLDFKGSSSNYIRFAGTDEKKWNSMQFDCKDGKLALSTANMVALGYKKHAVDFGTIPNTLFNLRISMDYIDYDRDGYEDDVKMGLWINETLTNANQYIYFVDMATYLGNNIIFAAPFEKANTENNPFNYLVAEEFTILASDIQTELSATSYDLTGTEGYTVPNTDTIYTEPGDYKVAFTEAGTSYSGNVLLYYEGDANLDKMMDSRDLVRIKQRTNPYDQFTFSDVGTIDMESTSMICGPVTRLTDMNKTAFRGKVTYADRTDTDTDSVPYNDRLYVGVKDNWRNDTAKAGLYIYYNHKADRLSINGTNYEIPEKVGDFIGQTVEYYITFDVADDTIISVVYVNNAKIAEVALAAVGNIVHAYSVDHTMTIESVEKEVVSRGTSAFESSDINNNGEIESADTMELRNALAGNAIDKEVVFGVISDTHFTGDGADIDRQERFEKALRYYREQGAEVIIMNADLTDHGEVGGYQTLLRIADEVYKDTPVELRPQFVTTADNHEYYEAWDWTTWGDSDYDAVKTRFSTYLSSLDTLLDGTNLNTCRTINGYTFIGVSRDGENSASATYTAQTLDWLDKQLATAQEENPSKPIFVAIHQPPTDTVSASGTDGTTAYNAVLAKYPQVVLFTSHTHAALEDEHSLYQGDYTVVNTGAVYYVAGLGKDINGGVSFENSSTADIYEFAQALLVRANGSNVDIQRCNFLVDEPATIKYNWTFDVADTDSFATYTAERTDTVAPTFAEGATATYNSATGVLTFPAASDNDFVYYYEITVEGKTYNYLTDFYQGIPQMDTTCAFKLSGVTSESVITIRAIDSYGNKSAVLGK